MTILSGFSDELVKKAHEVLSDLASVEKKLKPGDILVTKPSKSFYDSRTLFTRFRMRASEKLQGTPYTHSALYAGDGKVLEMGEWNRGGKTHDRITSVPLSQWAKRYNFRALRVDATPKERQEAVDFVDRQRGKRFDRPGLVRTIFSAPKIKPSERSKEYEDKSIREPKKFICSTLIASAFPNQPFSKNRSLKYVRPVDIQKSSLTHVISEYQGAK